jgi:hypothetical protein
MAGVLIPMATGPICNGCSRPDDTRAHATCSFCGHGFLFCSGCRGQPKQFCFDCRATMCGFCDRKITTKPAYIAQLCQVTDNVMPRFNPGTECPSCAVVQRCCGKCAKISPPLLRCRAHEVDE